ncbi:hypothetical protein HNQ36_001109 [Afipia massiliensis]|uniref:Uncharacterized protein n=1 Tax=Afipia massiliensis TaxID=211460 RepID=A0A840MTQ7_9BRAD|nr:hypothetical protein [Afipia massiliensis]MBB5051155.1 hypothetical protein [Afipia massiliensis]
MIEAETDAGESSAQFVTIEELRRRVSPKMGLGRFRATIKEAEERGFPRKSTIWGGWYWPKVKHWLDKDNEVENHEVVAGAQDGQEDFGAADASSRKKARPQARSPQPAVLVRQPGDARPEGLSRHLHSVATGRQ